MKFGFSFTEFSNLKVNQLSLLLLLLLGVVFIVLGCSDKDTGAQVPAKVDDAAFVSNEMLTREGVAECISCHVINPEIAMWQLSSHNRVTCITCHADVDLQEFNQKMNTNSYTLPIKLNSVIKDEVCTQCHSLNRVVTPSGDVIIPHQYHSGLGIRCTVCHDSVVHNRIDERLPKLEEKFQDYTAWTPELAEEVYHVRFTRPNMWTCLDCHRMLKATTQCAACHLRIPGLPSHEDPTWKTMHGVEGRNTLDECIHCHVSPIPAPPPEPSTHDPIADFARQTEFCYNCHLQLPESHSGKWLPTHPNAGITKGMPNCIACHDINAPGTRSNATATYCNRCHWFESDGSKKSY
ncbi:MAG: hypothetical protein KGZ96_06600 [Clostridia bacterium]|jgi:hypothetical protein|nr:hypothetical protein [Clostridia bacterium]